MDPLLRKIEPLLGHLQPTHQRVVIVAIEIETSFWVVIFEVDDCSGPTVLPGDLYSAEDDPEHICLCLQNTRITTPPPLAAVMHITSMRAWA